MKNALNKEPDPHDRIDPGSIMKRIILLTTVTIVLLISISKITNSSEKAFAPVQAVEATQIEEPVVEPEQPEIAPEEPEKAPTWRDNPNNCNTDTQWIWEDTTCHDKPPARAAAQSRPKSTPAPASSASSGSCEAEIQKYDWNKAVALNVARAESGLNPGALNDNPRTGDYSVGCFQINLYGGNARNRPSEAQLRNASVNVAFAYQIYKGNGSSFIGQWGVCRKISCY